MATENQKYTSEKTCVNQVPAAFKKIEWVPDTVNLDMGGGRFETATEYLKTRFVTNLVFDPYNRSLPHNLAVHQACKKRKADTATLCNVLNVIREPLVRQSVLRSIKRLLKKGGTLYISCYRGEGNKPRPTCNGWQENRPLRTYLPEIRNIFPNAELQGQIIVAKKG